MTETLPPQLKLAKIIAERTGVNGKPLSKSKAAEQLCVSAPGLLNWLKLPTERGAKIPAWPYRLAIRKWTEGSSIGPIEPEEWATDEDRQVVERVVPFVASRAGEP
jgi:hypothetical protein